MTIPRFPPTIGAIGFDFGVKPAISIVIPRKEPVFVPPPDDPTGCQCIEPWASYDSLHIPYGSVLGGDPSDCPDGDPCGNLCFTFELLGEGSELLLTPEFGGCVWTTEYFIISCSGGSVHQWVLQLSDPDGDSGVVVSYVLDGASPIGIYTFLAYRGCLGAAALAALPPTIEITLTP